MKKITWKTIREEFKKCHPRLHKNVIYWRPYSYATIVLYFEDGRMGAFDYDKKELVFMKEKWKS